MYGYHSFLGAGQETRPYGVSGEIQQNLTAGGASPPLRDGGETFPGGESAGGTWGRPYGDFRPFHSVRRYRIGFISCGGHRIAHDRNCLVGAGLLTRPSRFMETASSGTDTVPHPLPRMVGTRRGGEMEQAEILHRIRARWPGRNKTPEPYFVRRNFCGRA